MEHINEIEEEDLEEYKTLLEEKTQLEMKLISYQKYLEDKYLAGLDLEDGEFFLDPVDGLLYFWG